MLSELVDRYGSDHIPRSAVPVALLPELSPSPWTLEKERGGGQGRTCGGGNRLDRCKRGTVGRVPTTSVALPFSELEHSSRHAAKVNLDRGQAPTDSRRDAALDICDANPSSAPRSTSFWPRLGRRQPRRLRGFPGLSTNKKLEMKLQCSECLRLARFVSTRRALKTPVDVSVVTRSLRSVSTGGAHWSP